MMELALAGAIVGGAWLLSRARATPAATSAATPAAGLVFDVSGSGGVLAAMAARAATVEGVAESAAIEGAAAVRGALSPAFVGAHGGGEAPRVYTSALEPIFGDLSSLVTPWLSRPGAMGGLGASAGATPVAGGVVYALGYDRRGAWGEGPLVTDGDGVAWVHAGPSHWIGSAPLALALQREHAATGRTSVASALLWRLDWPRVRKDGAGSYFVEGMGVAEMRAGRFSAGMYARMEDAAREVALLGG